MVHGQKPLAAPKPRNFRELSTSQKKRENLEGPNNQGDGKLEMSRREPCCKESPLKFKKKEIKSNLSVPNVFSQPREGKLRSPEQLPEFWRTEQGGISLIWSCRSSDTNNPRCHLQRFPRRPHRRLKVGPSPLHCPSELRSPSGKRVDLRVFLCQVINVVLRHQRLTELCLEELVHAWIQASNGMDLLLEPLLCGGGQSRHQSSAAKQHAVWSRLAQWRLFMFQLPSGEERGARQRVVALRGEKLPVAMSWSTSP